MVARSRDALPTADLPNGQDFPSGVGPWQSFLSELERDGLTEGATAHARRHARQSARENESQEPLDMESVVRKLIELLNRDS